MEEGIFSDVIAITSQRFPTQNNFTFMYTKSADLYWATICWLLMRESEKFFDVGESKYLGPVSDRHLGHRPLLIDD